jgi:hypothetical protein
MSNAQIWAETFAPIDAHNREVINQQTWGHLAPLKNTSYKGIVLFTKSAYRSGTIDLLDTKFNDLEDSPWLYDFLHEHLYTLPDIEYGAVYQLNCTFRNYRIYGKPKLIYKIN